MELVVNDSRSIPNANKPGRDGPAPPLSQGLQARSLLPPMKSLFRFPWRRAAISHGVVGVVQRSDGLGLVHLTQTVGVEPPMIAHCLFQPAVLDTSRLLAEWVRRYGLEKARFVGLLDRSHYLLFPADKPALPREEWAINMRWKIADRIHYPPEQAVVELFDLPSQGAADKLYVAVAQERVVRSAVDLFVRADLPLAGLDILDLAMGRLTDHLPEDRQGLALLYWTAAGGVVSVRRDRQLFLARAIESREPAELADALQRTFRFYENNFAQPPLEQLFIVPMGEGCQEAGAAAPDPSVRGYEWRTEPLIAPASGEEGEPCSHFPAALAERLGMRVQWLPLERVLRYAPGIREADLLCCLPAVGAALGWVER
ncbi:MAG: hypothetical protein H7836_00170 [Magnetococcus sp. YQC-3]